MKTRLVTLGRLRLTTPAFDLQLGRVACWVSALLMLVITFWKMAALELGEAQLVFGTLLALVCPLLMVVMGLLLPGVRNQNRE